MFKEKIIIEMKEVFKYLFIREKDLRFSIVA